MSDQASISNDNSQFWNELCGSQTARALGVTDSSPPSLKKFDDWYFNFYPYLLDHIQLNELKNKKVLEIGLGYGTVSQRLAESGCHYTGLDIADGPVKMVNSRLKQNGLAGEAIQGSVLSPPFAPRSFDAIVAIGCLHHTGNLKSAIQNCHALLNPGGKLIFMVYSAYSYRRWWNNRSLTFNYLIKELTGYRGPVSASKAEERAAYDTSADGTAAPHTDFVSIKSMKRLCAEFSSFSGNYENIDQEPPFQNRKREELLKTIWPRLAGLDLYAVAIK